MSRDPATVRDILSFARHIVLLARGFDYAAFEKDTRTQFAVFYLLGIIGEASRRLSEAFRASHPDIPWRAISGMRNFLIHQYDAIDLTQVWSTIEHDIPDLIAKIEPLIPSDVSETDEETDASGEE